MYSISLFSLLLYDRVNSRATPNTALYAIWLPCDNTFKLSSFKPNYALKDGEITKLDEFSLHLLSFCAFPQLKMLKNATDIRNISILTFFLTRIYTKTDKLLL